MTLPSQFQRGRYTAACYRLMEITECVVLDAEAFIDTAVALGTDAEHCAELSERIKRAKSVLFEDEQVVTAYEHALEMLARMDRRGAD